MSALPCRGPLRAATKSGGLPPDRTLTIAAPARSHLPLEPRLTPYGRVSSRASAASYRNSAAMSERTNDRTENIGARRGSERKAQARPNRWRRGVPPDAGRVLLSRQGCPVQLSSTCEHDTFPLRLTLHRSVVQALPSIVLACTTSASCRP